MLNTTFSTNQNTNEGRNFVVKKPIEFTLIPVSYDDLLPYPLNNSMVDVPTYLSAGGRRVTRGCVFQERNTCGVATNVYLRKTSEKPKETGQNENSKFGSCIYA